MIDLSIVILTFNVQDYLLGCLKSIYQHTRDIEFEVIVVDNASTDDSVRKVRDEFPQVMLMANPTNEGFSRGNNLGILKAKGRAILILNSDTEIRGNVFKELVRALDSEEALGAVGPRLIYPDGRVQHFCARRRQSVWQTLRIYYIPFLSEPKLYLKSPRAFPGLYETDGLSGAAMVVKREVLGKVGGLDEGFWVYCEDADWSRRIAMSGYKLGCLTSIDVVHYHSRGLSQMEQKRRVEAIKSELRYFRKYSPAWERWIFRAGIVLNILMRMMTMDLVRSRDRQRRLAMDRAMLRCALAYRVNASMAQTREPIREAFVKEEQTFARL